MANQVYVGLCSPARVPAADYQAWGHSIVVDPNAVVLTEADEHEAIVYADLSPEVLESTRRNIPLDTQRRFDVYADVSQASVRLDE